MAINSVDRLRKGRPYAHGNNSQAAGPISITTAAAVSVAATGAKNYAASPTDIKTFNGKANWAHIVNLSANNSYWHVGNTTIAPNAAASGDGEVCQGNGGELWLECEQQGTPVLSGRTDTADGSHIVTWYQCDRGS